MRPIQARTSRTGMRRDGMWSWRHLWADSAMHGVMVMQRRRLRDLSVSGGDTIYPTSLTCRNHRIRPTLVVGMIEQAANVVNKEWIQLIRDFFLVGKIQCSVERNPLVLSVAVHRSRNGNLPNPF